MIFVNEHPGISIPTENFRILSVQAGHSIKVGYTEDSSVIILRTNYATGNQATLTIEKMELDRIYKLLPTISRTTSLQGITETKRKLLCSFLHGSDDYQCIVSRERGYSFIIKNSHPKYKKIVARQTVRNR